MERRNRMRTVLCGILACTAIWLPGASVAVYAQGVPGVAPNKCLAGKTKCVSSAFKGFLKCRERCQKNPTKCGSDQAACDFRVLNALRRPGQPSKSCLARFERKADPAKPETICATINDQLAVTARVERAVADLVSALEGAPPPICGNGVSDGDEQCDGADLAGTTCLSLGFAAGGTLGCAAGCGFDTGLCTSQAFPATGGTACSVAGSVVPCAGTGQDGDARAGAPLAYRDNGDGTITDLNTQLTWEKKSNDGSLHDQDNCYPWVGTCSGDTGTACGRNVDCAAVGGTCDAIDCQSGASGLTIFEWVDMLNAASFAERSDWRVPSVRDLKSILDYGGSARLISPEFDSACVSGCAVSTCSCTGSGTHWTATTVAGTVPSQAFDLSFTSGFVSTRAKSSTRVVRAVRGGS